MKTITEKVEDILKSSVEKDLAFTKEILKGFKNVESVVELSNHFYDLDALMTFFNELECFLNSYEHFIARIEGIYRYDGEDDECCDEHHIVFSISGGGDGVYDWGRIFKACAKNTLGFIKKFGGKVIMFDGGGDWTFG
jgi:hypothetical protein